MGIKRKLARWATVLKQQTLVVYFAARDPRTPLLVRLLAVLVAAYAVSPIDLIPDFIPVLGMIDDLILLPLAIALIIKLTPDSVIETATEKAKLMSDKLTNKVAAAAIVLIWLVLLLIAIRWLVSVLYG